MRNIIQNGGEWFAEAQRRVTSILPGKRGEDGEEELPADEPSGETALDDTETYAGSARKREGTAALREWVEQSKATLDEWQRKVDGHIRSAFEGISPFAGLHKDVKHLANGVAELETKLSKLEDEEEDL